jgi:hypothetical protein
MLSVIMLIVVMLSVIMLIVIMQSVIMLSVIMLSVIMLSVIMLSVIMVNVIRLCALAPFLLLLQHFKNFFSFFFLDQNKTFSKRQSTHIDGQTWQYSGRALASSSEG